MMLNSSSCNDNNKKERNSSNNPEEDIKQTKKVKLCTDSILSVQQLSATVEYINKPNDKETQLQSLVSIRNYLRLANNPPINEVLQSGILPSLIKFLSFDTQPLLQYESLWIIGNIASGDTCHTETIVNTGAIPILIKLLQSTNDDVVNMSLFALYNIAGDSVKHRDTILESGAMQLILNIIKNQSNINILRDTVKLIVNLFRGEPEPKKELIICALSTLADLLQNCNDEQVISNVTWAFSYYLSGIRDRIQDVINSNVCHRIAELFFHTNPSVALPALRTIGFVLLGDDNEIEFVLNIPVLPSFLNLLSNENRIIKKEVLWILYTIVSEGDHRIESVIEASIMPKVIKIISDENESNGVKIEAVEIISKVFYYGNDYQIDYVIKLDCITPIINLIENCKSNSVLQVVLETVKNLLSTGELYDNNTNQFVECIETCDGFEKIRLFSNHSNTDITSLVTEILNYKMETDE